ncbi:hypothetical protein H4R27_003208 [Coemansia aciculifera]|nr:hypothetical protein H4R27_003208 [Coemansia aciculifera]
MEGASFEASVRSPLRQWAQHTSPSQYQPAHAGGPRSPRPRPPSSQHQQSQQSQQKATALSPLLMIHHSPRIGYGQRGLASPMVLSGSGLGTPKTPTTPHHPAINSVAALDARGISRDFAHSGQMAGGDDRWRRLGARILPLFNGDRVVGSVEENSEMVRSCLLRDADAAWPEIHAILRVGMASLVRALYRALGVPPKFEAPQAGLPPVLSVAGIVSAGVGLDHLVAAVAGVWQTLYSHVLPYLDGVFLPLRLFKAAAARRRADAPGVRHAVLMHFRDSIVIPLLPSLDAAAPVCAAAARRRALDFGYAPPELCPMAQAVHMLSMLAALTPADRGPLHHSARAMAMALQS